MSPRVRNLDSGLEDDLSKNRTATQVGHPPDVMHLARNLEINLLSIDWCENGNLENSEKIDVNLIGLLTVSEEILLYSRLSRIKAYLELIKIL